MGPQGIRSFRALFAASVTAVLIGVSAATFGAAVALSIQVAEPGWFAFVTALLGIMLLTPPAAARLMGVGNHHLITAYAFGISCGCVLFALGVVYVPLIPFTPTVVAGATVAGIRFAEWNEE